MAPACDPAAQELVGAERGHPWQQNRGATPSGDVQLPDARLRQADAVQFLAFGDSGLGDDNQRNVARRMRDVCRTRGCDFAIHTGDILYPRGVQTPDDPWLREAFEDVYAPLGLPIYLSLGNHDHYGNPDAEIAYTARSPSRAWVLPARYYSFRAGGVRFLALDTSVPDEAQLQWAVRTLDAGRKSGDRFVVVYGHHPRVSYGWHGMADRDTAAFLDRVLCGRADVYIAGHEHDLQVLKGACGVPQVITGAAAQLRDTGRGALTQFASSELGFVWVRIDAQGFHADVLGTTGAGTDGGQVATRHHIDLPLPLPATVVGSAAGPVAP
jgi:3',5'-cyclic AMP phosphodiesterase CpdA